MTLKTPTAFLPHRKIYGRMLAGRTPSEVAVELGIARHDIYRSVRWMERWGVPRHA